MKNRDELVPTRVVDKNGRMMTVHKRASSLSGKPALIPAIKVPESESIETIVSGYLKRLKDRSVALSGESVRFPKYKLNQEQLRLAADLIDNPHAGKFMPYIIKDQMNAVQSEMLTVWLEVMNRQFTPVMRSGLLGNSEMSEKIASEHIGAIPLIQYSYNQNRGFPESDYVEQVAENKFTPEQERNVVIMTIAAWGTEIEGQRASYKGRYGPIRQIHNNELVDFAVSSTWEEVAAACVLLKKGGVTRVSELEALVADDVVAPVARGWL
jgi:hypothetical protein